MCTSAQLGHFLFDPATDTLVLYFIYRFVLVLVLGGSDTSIVLMAPRGNRKTKKTHNPLPSTSSHVFSVEDLITPPEAAPVASFVDRPTADGRKIVHESVRVEPPSPVKRARVGEHSAGPNDNATPAAPSSGEDGPNDCYTMEEGDDPPLPSLPKVLNPKRFEPSVRGFFSE
jgi:hypothetical protein